MPATGDANVRVQGTEAEISASRNWQIFRNFGCNSLHSARFLLFARDTLKKSERSSILILNRMRLFDISIQSHKSGVQYGPDFSGYSLVNTQDWHI